MSDELTWRLKTPEQVHRMVSIMVRFAAARDLTAAEDLAAVDEALRREARDFLGELGDSFKIVSPLGEVRGFNATTKLDD